MNTYITSLSGEVNVKLAGGAKIIKAFPNMALTKGDQIITGDDGNATIKVTRPESARTIGPNSRVTLSSQSSSAFSIKLWTGSLWSSETTPSGSAGAVVETPGSTIKAHGTNFLVTVQTDGTVSVFVASGLVSAEFTNSSVNSSVLVAPTQQLNVHPANLPQQLQNALSIVDISELAKNCSPSILKAMILDAPDIISENNELADKLQTSLDANIQPVIQDGKYQSDIYIKTLEDLKAFTANMDNLLSNIAYEAVQASKIDFSEMEQSIKTINTQIGGSGQVISLTNTVPIDPLAGVTPSSALEKQKEQARLEEYRKEAEQKLLLLQSEFKAQLKPTLQQILDLKNALDTANQSILNDLYSNAEKIYTAQLSPEERSAYDKNKQILEAETIASKPVVTMPDSSSITPTNSPEISILQERTTEGFNLSIHLKDFIGTNAIYAAEFHFISDSSLKASDAGSRLLNNSYFSPKNSVDIIKTLTGTSGNSAIKKTETIYAMTQFGVTSSVDILSGNLAIIPFTVSGSGTIKLFYVKIVDNKGNAILELSGDDAGLPPILIYGK